MSPSIDKLFNKNRLDGSALQLVMLMLYLPLGVVLLLVRLFISLQLILAVTVLPKGATITRLVVRCLCGVLGLFVRQQDLHHNPLYQEEEEGGGQDVVDGGAAKQRLVVFANHITPFDHFALSTVMPCVKLSCNGEGLPWPMSALLGSQVLTLQQPTTVSNRRQQLLSSPPPPPPRRDESFMKKLHAFITAGSNSYQQQQQASAASAPNLPLLLFPEDATTNGTEALLKYEPWSGAACGSRVCVVCVRVRRVPPLPLSCSVMHGSFVRDLLTVLFCPLTVYTVRYLGRVHRSVGESNPDFCSRVQQLSATALGLQATNYDVKDKVEHIKRYLTARQQQQQAPLGGGRTAVWTAPVSAGELHRLASQVQEVLPHLPFPAIVRDIARTGNVDMTITNFLEGAVGDFAPPPPPPPPPRAAFDTSTTTTTSNDNSLLASACSTSTSSSILNLSSISMASSASSSTEINLSTKSDTFSRSASDRMISFHERKLNLLENATRKYIEKYGINGENDPYLTKKCVPYPLGGSEKKPATTSS